MECWEGPARRAVYGWRFHDLYDDLHSVARFAAWLRRDDSPNLQYVAALAAVTDEARRVLGRSYASGTRKPQMRYLLYRATDPRGPLALANGDPSGELTGRARGVPEQLRHLDVDGRPWPEQLGLTGRDALLVEWLLEGRPYAWMGDRLGVTESRVSQLFREMSARVDRDLLVA